MPNTFQKKNSALRKLEFLASHRKSATRFFTVIPAKQKPKHTESNRKNLSFSASTLTQFYLLISLFNLVTTAYGEDAPPDPRTIYFQVNDGNTYAIKGYGPEWVYGTCNVSKLDSGVIHKTIMQLCSNDIIYATGNTSTNITSALQCLRNSANYTCNQEMIALIALFGAIGTAYCARKIYKKTCSNGSRPEANLTMNLLERSSINRSTAV